MNHWHVLIAGISFCFFSVQNSNACSVCMLPYIAAKTVTDINDGFNVCSIPQEQISRVLSSHGSSGFIAIVMFL